MSRINKVHIIHMKAESFYLLLWFLSLIFLQFLQFPYRLLLFWCCALEQYKYPCRVSGLWKPRKLRFLKKNNFDFKLWIVNDFREIIRVTAAGHLNKQKIFLMDHCNEIFWKTQKLKSKKFFCLSQFSVLWYHLFEFGFERFNLDPIMVMLT